MSLIVPQNQIDKADDYLATQTQDCQTLDEYIAANTSCGETIVEPEPDLLQYPRTCRFPGETCEPRELTCEDLPIVYKGA